MTDEAWKPIPSARGYEASSLGRVRSIERLVSRKNQSAAQRKGKVLSEQTQRNGYRTVVVGRNDRGAPQTRSVHRLVAEAFFGPCPAGLEVCHNNGEKADNRVENLRYDTRSANHVEKYRHGCRSNFSRPDVQSKAKAGFAEAIRRRRESAEEIADRL
jgi:hypothetical protein